MTVQEMLDIASRHYTLMADAMIAACVEWGSRAETNLNVPERQRTVDPYVIRVSKEQWERLVRENAPLAHITGE